MVHQKENISEKALTILYILTTIISFLVIYAIHIDTDIISLFHSKQYAFLLFSISFIWYLLINIFDITKFHRFKSNTQIFIDHCIFIGLGIGCVSIIIVILKFGQVSRFVLILFALLNLIWLFSGRLLTEMMVKAYRSKGHNIRNLAIVADDNSEEVIQKFILNKNWGYKIKVIITDSESITNKYFGEYTIKPASTDIDKYIESETIDEVIFCKTDYTYDELRQLIYSCHEIGVSIHFISRIQNLFASKAHVTYLENMSFFSFYKGSGDYIGLKIKIIFDYLFSFLILVLFSPLLLIIAIGVKLTSKGPVIFKQDRVGLRGRRFSVYKFRTMVHNAEAIKGGLMDQNDQSGPVFKMKKDPRVTKIGKFLRKTSLDEFPQFFNVLKGDMSIVGPRPSVPSEVEQYKRWQLRRLSMKPGITCIWQVSGRNKITFEEWMKMDLEYIDHWSLKFDFVLIIKTIFTIFAFNGQ